LGENTFLGGKIFVFIICLKQIFLGTTKFGEAQKFGGGTVPEYTPRATGLGKSTKNMFYSTENFYNSNIK